MAAVDFLFDSESFGLLLWIVVVTDDVAAFAGIVPVLTEVVYGGLFSASVHFALEPVRLIFSDFEEFRFARLTSTDDDIITFVEVPLFGVWCGEFEFAVAVVPCEPVSTTSFENVTGDVVVVASFRDLALGSEDA